MKTTDALLREAADAGFPTIGHEVLVDAGPLALRVRLRPDGDTVNLRIRLLWGDHAASRDTTYRCPAEHFVQTLRLARDIIREPIAILNELPN